MSEPKRLHPMAVVSSVFKQLKDMIFPIFAVTVFGRNGSEWGFFSFFLPMAVLAFIVINGILSWYRFTYRIEDNELRIESGVLVRKKRYIPFERIQSLDQSEGILHRSFALVKLKVETAAPGAKGSEDSEAVFSAISKEEVKRFQAILNAVKDANLGLDEEIPKEQNIIYKISQRELLLLAFTSGGTGVIISAAAAFLSQFDEIIPYKRVYSHFESFIASGLFFAAVVVFLGFLAVWFLAFVWTMIKYANFTVTKSGEDLVITRGLIEKRKITVPIKRIQSIRITQNLLRQPLGFGTVFLENAGGSRENDELASVIVLPIVKRKMISSILHKCLPDYDLDASIRPVPKRALKRYLLRGWLVALPIIFVPVFLFRPWGWLLFLIILPVTGLHYLGYRDAGWSISGEQLSLQFRQLNKNIVYMKKRKLQAVRINESFFQKKKKLATLNAIVKSGNGGAGGRVLDIDQEDASFIFKWFSRGKQS